MIFHHVFEATGNVELVNLFLYILSIFFQAKTLVKVSAIKVEPNEPAQLLSLESLRIFVAEFKMKNLIIGLCFIAAVILILNSDVQVLCRLLIFCFLDDHWEKFFGC